MAADLQARGREYLMFLDDEASALKWLVRT